MHVIIVEDEAITVLFLKKTIENLGHNVVSVFDEGEALLTYLKINEVDVIFMDIQINGKLDGIQVANLIHSKYPEINFVFLTSFKDSQTIEDASSVNPIGYLIKPVTKRELEAILMVAKAYHPTKPLPLSSVIYLGSYAYYSKEHVLYEDGTLVMLSKNEHLCLQELISSQNHHVSTEQLILSIWGDEKNRISSLRELTSRLRKKLPKLQIESIPNIGYILLNK